MKSVQCQICCKELADWQGNVMVDDESYTSNRLIKELTIICKDCTKKLDTRDPSNGYHNLWELVWVRDNYFFLLNSIFADFNHDYGLRWSAQALDDFLCLAKLRFGEDLAKNP